MKLRHFSFMNVLACACLVSVALTQTCYACPDGQSKGLFGWCYQNVGGEVGKVFEKLKNEAKAETLGPVLAPDEN